jgi:hypothetical protein
MDAVSACHAQNSYLVTIKSSVENNWLTQYRFAHGIAASWIGLNSFITPFEFHWIGGTDSSFNQGGPGNAGGIEHCVEFFPVSGLWNDKPCSGYGNLPALCQYDSELLVSNYSGKLHFIVSFTHQILQLVRYLL